MIDNQVRSLRKRQVIGSFVNKTRKGAYWDTRMDIDELGVNGALDCPHVRTLQLAQTPTRLNRMGDVLQRRLINWGYAISDGVLRKYYDTSLPEPAGFPFPDVGV
jgi:NTE family protein